MNILVTGAKGFVGKNLCAQLNNIISGKAPSPLRGELEGGRVFEYDIDSSPEDLDRYCREADFVFNLAGVNRPENPEDFRKGNFGFASTLLDTLKKHGNKCPVMLSSSIQATLTGRYAGHPYGESKKAGEDLFFEYAKESGAKVLVYRFPNLFGKWCRPNYNSAVATFCNNIANDLPIQVNDPSVELELLYIDDLVDEMIRAIQGCPTPAESPSHAHAESPTPVLPEGEEESTPIVYGVDGIKVEYKSILYNRDRQHSPLRGELEGGLVPIFHVTLGEIVDLLYRFKEQPQTLIIPEIPTDSFAKRLYSTYLSYLPKDKAIFDLKMNVDNRGSFTELVKTLNCGQVSINISKPGITKGQHWHNTKWEQFIVVSGHGLIQMRNESPTPTLPAGEGVQTRQALADPINYPLLKDNAKRMRSNPTEAESLMWDLLRNKKLDTKFSRQHIVDNYILDFVDLDSGLAIEVDGEYHNAQEQKEADAMRTQILMQKGFSVIRFTNDEIIRYPENVLDVISNALKHLKSTEASISLPCGKGRGGALNYFVSGDKIQSVIMLPGYTHNIINLSDTEDLVTVMYCNELFDPHKPDTYFDPV